MGHMSLRLSITSASAHVKSFAQTALLLTVLTLPAFARAEAGGYIARTTITRVVVHDWQTAIWVYFSAQQPNVAGCPNNDFVVIKADHGFFKELYAAALAASLSGMSVGGFVWGCHPDFKRPVLTRLDLLPSPSTQYP